MLQANCPVHGQWKKLMLRIPPDVHGAALVARYQVGGVETYRPTSLPFCAAGREGKWRNAALREPMP
jgi:hypothetical protein